MVGGQNSWLSNLIPNASVLRLNQLVSYKFDLSKSDVAVAWNFWDPLTQLTDFYAQ